MCVCTALLTACSGSNGNLSSMPTTGAPQGVECPQSDTLPASGTVFVPYAVSSGGLVEVWPPPYTKPTIKITKDLGPYA